jgi:hypothetical protein
MRFTVEQRHLTDIHGKPIGDEGAVTFHTYDAENVDAVVGLFLSNDAEVIGEVLRFPGFQAMATVRNASGVYTLQITPSSQQVRGPGA